jgi:hypothetical protein
LDDDETERVSTKKRAKALTSSRRRVRFAEIPPPPRSGPAHLARALACCCQGEWVAARSAAGVAVGVFDRGAGDARLADLARCLGACADAHLGHWESALHAVASLARDRKRHAEIAPWCLAIRVAALVAVGDPKTALLTWREATSKAPFAGLKLDAYQFEEHDASRATDAECGARDMPAYVACRAFAAQAAWGAGERREATRLAEQTAGLMKMMRAPTHPLLPAAALAAGETLARACAVDAVDRRRGKRALAECHAFLRDRAPRLLPFAAELAQKLQAVL